MPVLTQDDRISISKKLALSDKENAQALDNKAKLDDALDKAEQADNANKAFFDEQNNFVLVYQNELKRYDGNGYNTILEQDLIDSAKNKFQSYFSPNDALTPLPSLPDGVWKQFNPFALSLGLGKNYNETYTTIQKEGDIISAIQAYITTMESYTAIQRSSGQSCSGGVPSCSNPMYLDQASCELNGFVWSTPPDTIANDAAIQTLSTNIITEVNNWKAFVQTTVSTVYTLDTDPTRSSQNNASIADGNNSVSVINSWLAYSAFDTGHGQTTCAGFNAYDVSLLSATKYRAGELAVLKNEITARLAYIVTRMSQLNTYLGTVSQDVNTGAITSSSGFLGSRFNFIILRLHISDGTLRKKEGIKLGQKASDEKITINNLATSVYSTYMKSSLFSAPSTGGKNIHLKNASDFANGNAVYVYAETQEEIAANIVTVTGSLIILDTAIPAKYTTANFSRMYKVL